MGGNRFSARCGARQVRRGNGWGHWEARAGLVRTFCLIKPNSWEYLLLFDGFPTFRTEASNVTLSLSGKKRIGPKAVIRFSESEDSGEIRNIWIKLVFANRAQLERYLVMLTV